MTTLEQATKAKEVLRSAMGRPRWLRGVGIGKDHKGYFVKVNVDVITPELRQDIPRDVDGVRVWLDAVGDILAGG